MGTFVTGRLRSIGYALAGVAHLVRSQPNAWVHAAATILVVAAGALLHLHTGEWCWLIVAMVMVWAAEALNTAVELLADATCPAQHPLIGKAKDAAAGGVLLAAIGAVAIGGCVMLPHVW